MRLLPFLLFATLLLSACQSGDTAETPAAESETNAISVTFAYPADGATLQGAVPVSMDVQGMEVAPAGTMEDGTGHLHILVNTPFVTEGEVIPVDDQHIHYGDGSVADTLLLPTGTHTLRLQMADGVHRAFTGPAYTDEITVTVQE